MPFDIVLMDMEMPHIDGIEATRLIRALPDGTKAGIPVIAMTGNVRSEDIERCRKAGMNDHISKPINPENLRALLLKYAPRAQAAAAAPPSPAPVAAAPAPAAPVDPAKFEQQKLFSLDVLGELKKSLGQAPLKEMMDGLYQKSEELIADAEKCVKDNDAKNLGGRGHDIKGMTANFGLTELSSIAGQIERKAKDGWAADKLADLVEKLRPTYDETRKLLDAWISQ